MSYSIVEKRPRMKRKIADELCNDEALTSVENMYQVTMLEIIDRVITELSDRFESLNNVNSMFGFLSGVKIEEMQTADLKIKAENLANIYSADLNIDEFMFEIESFKHHALTVHFVGIQKFIYNFKAFNGKETNMKSKLDLMKVTNTEHFQVGFNEALARFNHVIHPLVPPIKTATHNLRQRKHNYQAQLSKRSFNELKTCVHRHYNPKELRWKT
ncbi:hypothetical protein HELRODRAFT_171362 [Helobdella robusta]|uniref:Uncharacterized protein n=1 Tax=Helobdella robusta TaxID=6412 RepID=T1F463_HELRO|nr:hypothetical protein HELRODRAFT_171362 [Helobdella robusta]ESO05701.1 hypothetical protein HELRODRAFT_171362 [Helobdella robusta]